MQEQLLALMFADGLPHVSVRIVPASAMFGGPFRLFTFTKHSPLVYPGAQVAGLFIEDAEYVRQYELLIPEVADAALRENLGCSLPLGQASSTEGAWVARKKGSFSEGANTDCVEVALSTRGASVRDSKNATGPVLGLEAVGWANLISWCSRG
jgi:hypothetical protein